MCLINRNETIISSFHILFFRQNLNFSPVSAKISLISVLLHALKSRIFEGISLNEQRNFNKKQQQTSTRYQIIFPARREEKLSFDILLSNETQRDNEAIFMKC